MVIVPKIRNNTCITSHPKGCEVNVCNQIGYARRHKLQPTFKNVLVIGASTGYGLASRIVAAFSGGAATLGVAYEKPASEKACGTVGWYNTCAFEKYARQSNLPALNVNADAFQPETKGQVIELISSAMGKIDLIIYSLAAPRRYDPEEDRTYYSTIKPIGKNISTKSLDFMNEKVTQLTVAAASDEQIMHTVKVMGGEDWELWIKALDNASLLATGAKTVAFSYIGSELTYPFYRHGTLGKAKEHLENTARKLDLFLRANGGRAFTSVNKAVVTRASAVIPGVPLYISILYKIMKAKGIHEGCIEQSMRLFENFLLSDNPLLDAEGRIRLDDFELRKDVQAEVKELWHKVTSDNLTTCADLEGFKSEFHRFFGFGFPEVNYTDDIPTHCVAQEIAV
ncbi:MAG: trans-2-enoyl-CoA reductase family protein [Spirochaetales bacterium]|nr:trans-2-enoyl-CoA reductase family protein [Spirochaetales bacterium]